MIWLLLFACSSAPQGHDDHGHEDPHGHEEAHGHHDEHADHVELSDAALQAARLTVEAMELQVLRPELRLPGRIQLDPRKEAVVSTWIGGQVDAIEVRPGDPVRRLQTLATVQSPDLGEAIAAFRAAKARDTATDARLERIERLQKDGVTSMAQVLAARADHEATMGELEAAEERLRVLGVDPGTADPHKGGHYPSHVPVRSPIAGKVLTTDASVGRRVAPGETLFHVGDLREVWLLIDVFEGDLAAVAKDQPVQFEVEAWPGEVFEGHIEQVGDWVEPDARTVEVRVVVSNEDERLKPNMFAEAHIAISGGEEGIVVPTTAVQDLEGRQVVFVRTEPNRFDVRHVEIAGTSGRRVRIGHGLELGEEVVTEGAFTLKSELQKGELGGGHAH